MSSQTKHIASIIFDEGTIYTEVINKISSLIIKKGAEIKFPGSDVENIIENDMIRIEDLVTLVGEDSQIKITDSIRLSIVNKVAEMLKDQIYDNKAILNVNNKIYISASMLSAVMKTNPQPKETCTRSRSPVRSVSMRGDARSRSRSYSPVPREYLEKKGLTCTAYLFKTTQELCTYVAVATVDRNFMSRGEAIDSATKDGQHQLLASCVASNDTRRIFDKMFKALGTHIRSVAVAKGCNIIGSKTAHFTRGCHSEADIIKAFCASVIES